MTALASRAIALRLFPPFIFTINNLKSEENIMNFKEAQPDNCIMLFGNHDLQHLGYPWANCSGLDFVVYRWMSSKNIANRFLKCAQAIYIQDNIIFSHAGISKKWWENQFMGEPTAENLLKLNEIEPCEMFAFTPDHYNDWSGNFLGKDGVNSIQDFLNNIDDADVVEVVRCKDCRMASQDKILVSFEGKSDLCEIVSFEDNVVTLHRKPHGACPLSKNGDQEMAG